MGRKTGKHIHRHIDTPDRQADRQTCGMIDRESRLMQSARQTDREMDKQIDRQTHRQAKRHAVYREAANIFMYIFFQH